MSKATHKHTTRAHSDAVTPTGRSGAGAIDAPGAERWAFPPCARAVLTLLPTLPALEHEGCVDVHCHRDGSVAVHIDETYRIDVTGLGVSLTSLKTPRWSGDQRERSPLKASMPW